MKKLIAVLFIIFTMISTAYAENKLNFDGKEYYLRFSEKSAEHNGFYNQYYKAGEDMDNWTEMVAVHHFPNVFLLLSRHITSGNTLKVFTAHLLLKLTKKIIQACWILY